MSYYHQNSEELDGLDLWEKGDDKPKVVVLPPVMPEPITVKPVRVIDWDRAEDRAWVFRGLHGTDN